MKDRLRAGNSHSLADLLVGQWGWQPDYGIPSPFSQKVKRSRLGSSKSPNKVDSTRETLVGNMTVTRSVVGLGKWH
jgi:hypothetical protein